MFLNLIKLNTKNQYILIQEYINNAECVGVIFTVTQKMVRHLGLLTLIILVIQN